MLYAQYLSWGYTRNCMRELTAYANTRKAEIGEDKVFDFALGNPNVPAPETVKEALAAVNRGDPAVVHAATPPEGLPALRRAVAEDLNARLSMPVTLERVYMTCGAAAGLAICCHGLLSPGEEAVMFAPFFTEYRVFTEGAQGVAVVIPPDGRLQPDLEAFEQALNEKTRMVLVNSPNNPSGVILSDETLERLGGLLRAAQKRWGHPIYLVSDEPYREIVYDRDRIPSVMDHYDNAIVCYSFSKSLSLPGERIGYLALSSRMEAGESVFDALAQAAADLGYRQAPAMIQQAVISCLGQTSDLAVYRKNRDLLYDGLTEVGFSCVKPEGAFYLFVKSPDPDAKAFSERAKKYELILVPSDDFGVTGWLRLAYCVSTEMIRRSLPAFRALARDCGLSSAATL